MWWYIKKRSRYLGYSSPLSFVPYIASCPLSFFFSTCMPIYVGMYDISFEMLVFLSDHSHTMSPRVHMFCLFHCAFMWVLFLEFHASKVVDKGLLKLWSRKIHRREYLSKDKQVLSHENLFRGSNNKLLQIYF